MGWPEVVGICIGIALIFRPVIKFILGEWVKAREKVEELKEAAANRALSRLENDTKEFRLSLDRIEVQIKSLSNDMTVHKMDINSLKQELGITKKLISDFNAQASDKIKNMIKTEVANLTQQLMLIRNKKNSP